jgi:hypothetical protein
MKTALRRFVRLWMSLYRNDLYKMRHFLKKPVRRHFLMLNSGEISSETVLVLILQALMQSSLTANNSETVSGTTLSHGSPPNSLSK